MARLLGSVGALVDVLYRLGEFLGKGLIIHGNSVGGDSEEKVDCGEIIVIFSFALFDEAF